MKNNLNEEHPIASLIGTLVRLIIRLGLLGFVGWLVVSFVEILFRNGNPDVVYTTWNFWAKIFK